MPVPVAPVDRQIRAVLFEFAFQSGDKFPGLLVDGALALKMVVVFGDREHALPRNVSPPKHVFKKRNDIFSRFGTTERDNQDGVIIRCFRGHSSPLCTLAVDRTLTTG